MKPAIILASFALLLGGCAQLTALQNYGAQGAARAVMAECTLSPLVRQQNLSAVNGALVEQGSAARATALDCDGDGASDF